MGGQHPQAVERTEDLKVNGIDPGHVADADGKRYLYLSEGKVVQLSDDGLSTVGEVKKVYDGWPYPRNWRTEGMYLESPKLNYHNGYYYLTSAEGGTAGPGTSHMVVTARSKSVLGPWENSPFNPLVHTYSERESWWSRGHGTLIDDVNGNWWVVYHAYAKGYHTLGRQTLIEPIQWTPDGWCRAKSAGTLPKAEVSHPPRSGAFRRLPRSETGPAMDVLERICPESREHRKPDTAAEG